ncbi:MAG TPA: hypothetical protein VIR30_11940 [Nocardioides sp.]
MDQQPHRNAFPEDAVTWLLGTSPRTVAVLGDVGVAEACAALGHDVTDVEGSTRGQALPFTDRSVDAVVAIRTVPRDLEDVARVLRPGGQLALVHNQRDRRIPWARKLDDVLRLAARGEESAERIISSPLFGFVSDAEFRHWQTVNNETLPLVLAHELTQLDESARHQRLDAALELYADYGRGADGMQLPWLSRCHRATVVESAWAPPHAYDERPTDGTRREGETDQTMPSGPSGPPKDDSGSAPAAPQDGSDSDLLLIDFR